MPRITSPQLQSPFTSLPLDFSSSPLSESHCKFLDFYLFFFFLSSFVWIKISLYTLGIVQFTTCPLLFSSQQRPVIWHVTTNKFPLMAGRMGKRFEYLLSLSNYHCIKTCFHFFTKSIHEICFWEGGVCVNGRERAVLEKPHWQQFKWKSVSAWLSPQTPRVFLSVASHEGQSRECGMGTDLGFLLLLLWTVWPTSGSSPKLLVKIKYKACFR